MFNLNWLLNLVNSLINPGFLNVLFGIIVFVIVWVQNKKFPINTNKIAYSFLSGALLYGIIASLYFVIKGEFILGDKTEYKIMAGLSALIYLWLFVKELKRLFVKRRTSSSPQQQTAS